MKKKLLAVMTALIMAVTGGAGFMMQTADVVSAGTEDPYAVQTLEGEVPTEQQNYMTDSQYKKLLGVDLSSKDVAAFDPDDTYNPLDGYQPAVLSELFLGYMNRSSNYNGYFTVMENASADSGFNMDTMWNTNYGGNNKYYGKDSNDEMFTHAINTIALTPGDMTEEGAHLRQQILIESRLVLMEDGVLHEDDTHQMLSTYTYDGSAWNRKACTDTCIAGSHWAWRIDVAEQQSYTAMAVGDYDGDNYNEVAVYVPSSNTSGEMAKVDIYQPEQDGNTYSLTKEYSFRIDEMGDRFNVWMEKYHSYVQLSTTHMAGRDDLVVSVTQPFLTEEEFTENGALAVWSFQNKNKKLEFNNELEYDGYRFKMSATANADINGDGVDETVVGGFKNTDYDKDGSARGSISDSEYLVNVLLYEDGAYRLAWNKPQTVNGINLDHSKEADAPAAIAAGKFRSSAAKDTVFLEGVYLDFAAGGGKTGNEQIRNGKFTQDNSESMSGMSDKTINLGACGSFVSDKTALEQVAFYTVEGTSKVDVDIVWGHPGSDGKIMTGTVNDNYLDNKTADGGTIVTMCPVNVDEDSALMKYAGKSVGWSNPVVYSVLMSMPYWQEMDYGTVWNDRGETDFGVTKTQENGTEVTVGVDVEKSLTISAEEQMIGNGIAVGIDLAYLPSYAHSTTDTESLAKSITWSSGGGVNSAALLVMPVITYKYDVIVPAHNATEEEKAAGKDGVVEEYKTTILCTDTKEPVYTQVSVDTYNDVVEEFNAMAKDEDKLPVIDLNEIYKGAVMGDPSTYAEKPEDISSVSGSDYLYAGEMFAQTGKGKAVETLSIETETGTSESNGFSLGLKAGYMGEIMFGFNVMSILSVEGKLGLGVSGQIAPGGTWVTTTSTGITYAGSFANIPDDAEGYGYEYSAGLVKWNASLQGHDEDLTFEDTDETLPDKTVIIAPVVQMDAQVPPALPLDLHVLGVTENKAVLEWTNPASSRAADYYKIYYSKEADGQYYPLEGTVSGSRTKHVVSGLDADTTYYFRLEAYDSETSLRSVQGPAVAATTKAGAGPAVTVHPKDVFADIGEAATFTIEAKPQTEGNTISYQWQQLVEEDYGISWVDINVAADPEIGKEAAFNAAYASPGGLVREEDVDDLNGNIYRCIVTEHVSGKLDYTETISNTATLYAGKDLPAAAELELNLSSGEEKEQTHLQLAAGDEFTADAALKDSTGTAIAGAEVNFALMQGNKCVKYIMAETGADGIASVTFEDVAAGEYEVIAVKFKDDASRAAVSDRADVIVAEVHEIVYELNGGINHNLNPKVFSEGTKSVRLRDASRPGAEFTGWYLDEALTQKVEDNILSVDSAGGSITLYAGWKAIPGDSGKPGGSDSDKPGDSDKPDSGDSGSQTGDDFNMAVPLVLMLCAVSVLGALLARRRK